MDNLNKVIANNMSKLRKAHNLTQVQLAEKLSYSDKAVSKWERGESIPDINILKQLADMYGVTVDYLLSETHKPERTQDVERVIRKNRFIITLLAVCVVWLLATIVHVTLTMSLGKFGTIWLAYIVAIPLSCIVLLVFNSIWGRVKWNFAIITVLLWSVLLTLFLILRIEHIWLIFVLGIPGQVMIVLWSRLKRVKTK